MANIEQKKNDNKDTAISMDDKDEQVTNKELSKRYISQDFQNIMKNQF